MAIRPLVPVAPISSESTYSLIGGLRSATLPLFLCVLFGSLPLAAQNGTVTPASRGIAQSEGTSNVTLAPVVKQVSILAVVRDKHGKIVPDLTANDFTVEEDGHPMTISFFKHQFDAPLKLGLLVDTGINQRPFIDVEKSESKSFLDQLLRDTDAAFVIHFDHEVELLQDFTSSKPKLESSIEQLQSASFSNQQPSPDDPDSSGGQSSGRGQGRGMHRSALLYDSIYLASDELMEKQQGCKVLVILSDGVDRGSKESLESALESAQRANTIVYAIYLKGEEEFSEHRGGFGGPRMGGPMGGGRRGGGGQYPREARPDGKKILEQIASETGGRFIEVSKKQPLNQIYSSIAEDLRNQYMMGFIPEKDDSPGYHKLAVKAKTKDTDTQARAGFYWAQ